jgi:hypothetical protein
MFTYALKIHVFMKQSKIRIHRLFRIYYEWPYSTNYQRKDMIRIDPIISMSLRSFQKSLSNSEIYNRINMS